jgi:hypothetical protein
MLGIEHEIVRLKHTKCISKNCGSKDSMPWITRSACQGSLGQAIYNAAMWRVAMLFLAYVEEGEEWGSWLCLVRVTKVGTEFLAAKSEPKREQKCLVVGPISSLYCGVQALHSGVSCLAAVPSNVASQVQEKPMTHCKWPHGTVLCANMH